MVESGVPLRLLGRNSPEKDEEIYSDDEATMAHSSLTGLLHRDLHKNMLPHRSCLNRGLRRIAMFAPVLTLVVLGCMHFLEALIGRSRLLFNFQEGCDFSKVDWSKLSSQDKSYGSTKDIVPIPCHSHNDYQRPSPLYDALKFGFTSVEADIHMVENELLVGHDASTLHRDSTLRSMYLDPIKNMLDDRNRPSPLSDHTKYGIFEVDPSQTLVLLIDFKQQQSDDAFDMVQQQLEPLRTEDYLTYWNGHELEMRAITVVGTGDAPFHKILEAGNHRDIFYDAPLNAVSEVFNSSNSYYASTNFRASVGQIFLGHLLPHQMSVIRREIQSAHAAGLRARYWGTPSWPMNLRNHVWHVLMKEGADILNADDLRAASSLVW